MGKLDYLIIDLPPGTGDAQLTLAQSSKLSGSIIVSTPQDVALNDARKGINMFKRVNVPVIGLIENMSYFICEKCDEKHYIFSHEGAKEAEKFQIPFLGSLPIDKELRIQSDEGRPACIDKPEWRYCKIYIEIAKANFLNIHWCQNFRMMDHNLINLKSEVLYSLIFFVTNFNIGSFFWLSS